jgi:hypothetical protein
MAQLASTRFGADWVINSDADEFWWARNGSLKEVFGAVPNRFGSVRGMWRNFVPRSDETGPLFERMIVRSQDPVENLHPFNTHFKTAHRGSADVEVGGGNHDVLGSGMVPLPGWYPIDVLHFPIRSLAQFERKFLRWCEITSVNGFPSNPFYGWVRDAKRDGRMAEFYDEYSVDDQALELGLANGTLVEDMRLRDALRSLHSGLGNMDMAQSTIDRGYLIEFGYIERRNAFARAQERIDGLEARLSRLENGVARRVPANIGRVVRGGHRNRPVP